MSFDNIFTNGIMDKAEFNKLIADAKNRQLDSTKDMLSDLNFIQERLMEEILPEKSIRVLVQKRHKLKALKNASKKRI